MKLKELTGKDILESLRLEHGRLVDAMADSQSWLHGKTYVVYGDPDFVYAMAHFITEMRASPSIAWSRMAARPGPRRVPS